MAAVSQRGCQKKPISLFMNISTDASIFEIEPKSVVYQENRDDLIKNMQLICGEKDKICQLIKFVAIKKKCTHVRIV